MAACPIPIARTAGAPKLELHNEALMHAPHQSAEDYRDKDLGRSHLGGK